MALSMEVCQKAALKRGGIVRRKVGHKYEWQCGEGHLFLLTGHQVHRRGKWCTECGSSIGERKIREVLREWEVEFKPQAVLPSLPSRRYDFSFTIQGVNFMIEYDGEQHFRYVRKYHRKKAALKHAQCVDRVKTWVAIQSGYRVIRIDYENIGSIEEHMRRGVEATTPLYLSDLQKYQYLLTPITTGEIQSLISH